MGLNETYLSQWSHLIAKRYYDISHQFLSIGHNKNITQIQHNERVDNKLQYLIDGQRKLGDDISVASQTITATVTKSIMESVTHIGATLEDPPPPKKKQRQMLIVPMSNRVPDGCTSNELELNMKHISISATINDFYSKQYYQCISSNNSTSNSASQALKKMRLLINSLHYLAEDDVGAIAWCKTPANQRADDWSTKMVAKSLLLQDLAIQKLREYGVKCHNKDPVFWSTVKIFQQKGLLDHAINHYM